MRTYLHINLSDKTIETEGLSGEAIILTARIVAVANAFVDLCSPRESGTGLSLEAATARLRASTGR